MYLQLPWHEYTYHETRHEHTYYDFDRKKKYIFFFLNDVSLWLSGWGHIKIKPRFFWSLNLKMLVVCCHKWPYISLQIISNLFTYLLLINTLDSQTVIPLNENERHLFTSYDRPWRVQSEIGIIFVSYKLFEISRIIFSLNLSFSHLRFLFWFENPMSINMLARVCNDNSDMEVKPS